jgi:hypothetical protein
MQPRLESCDPRSVAAGTNSPVRLGNVPTTLTSIFILVAGNSISKSFVSRRLAEGIAVARQGETTTTGMI